MAHAVQVGVGAASAALLLAGCGAVASAEPPTPSVPNRESVAIPVEQVCGPRGPLVSPAETAPSGTATGALSGASGAGVADGAFGAWRGTPVTIAGTWNDSLETQTLQCTLLPGYEYGAWSGDIDVAVGAIYIDRGESWQAAAEGAYDSRWEQALTSIRTAWSGRPGTVHIRFAHEFNGDWVPWRVSGGDVPAFIAAWKRFRALQQRILPDAALVFCPNDGTSASLDLDWRDAFPGSAYVDEMAVDSYNQRDFATTPEEFRAKIEHVDGRGVPVGIEQHRRFAESVGLPMAVAEWGTNADIGDGAAFVELFHAWVVEHAGTGPGQVPYEVVFNVAEFDAGQFQLFPTTRQPGAAAAYVAVF